LAYIAVAYLFAFFPIEIPVVPETMNWASAVYGGIVILATGYYLVYARHVYVPPAARLAKDV
jgi:choline transport protein